MHPFKLVIEGTAESEEAERAVFEDFGGFERDPETGEVRAGEGVVITRASYEGTVIGPTDLLTVEEPEDVRTRQEVGGGTESTGTGKRFIAGATRLRDGRVLVDYEDGGNQVYAENAAMPEEVRELLARDEAGADDLPTEAARPSPEAAERTAGAPGSTTESAPAGTGEGSGS